MRIRAIVLIVLVVPFFVPGLAADAPPCPGFQHVPAQGPSCPVADGWEVLLDDGTRLLTHGPDPAMPGADDDLVVAGFVSEVPPPCVPTSGPHHRLIYVYPSDAADRSATMVPTLRLMVNQSNGWLREDALAAGRRAEFTFRCDGDGLVHVDVVRARASAGASFSTIVSDVRAAGVASSLAKHWIWYDGGVGGGIAGQGNFRSDDRASVDNPNNAGDSYAITYGYTGEFGVKVLLHENGHNMGAVQNSAPHTSGAAHCNDGVDVMCYADGGSRSDYTESACSGRAPYDCNGDDYFHPAPPAGSYLATHWNIGSPINKYLSFGPGVPLVRQAVCYPGESEPGQEVWCTVTGHDRGEVHYTIDWGDGATTRLPAEGALPSGQPTGGQHAYAAVGDPVIEVRVHGMDGVSDPTRIPHHVGCAYYRGGYLLVGNQGALRIGKDVDWRDLRDVPAWCRGEAWELTHDAGAVFEICWRGDAGPLSCTRERAGTFPVDATGGEIRLIEGVYQTYALRRVPT